MRRLYDILPVIGFIALEIILFATNFTSGTTLAGWDNLMPEFGFWHSLQRNIFGVWQGYRGLGLFDGQSHAAATIHTLLVGLLSLFQTPTLTRYIVTFGMHALGIIGMYYLTKTILGQSRSKGFTSVIAALFYGFNPATIQMFYTPFEPFTVHFAALPWMAYGLHEYFSHKQIAGVTLLIIFLLSTPQFFVPTLFIPTAILVAIVSLSHIRTLRKHVVALALGFLLINAFWLLPYLAGLRTNAPVIANAKINQMSSADIFLRDQEYGDAKNIMLLRGFPLAFEDFDQNGAPIFLMKNWRTYLDLPITLVSGWLFAALAVVGFIISVLRKKPLVTPLVISGMLAFLFLAVDVPVFREINLGIRALFPSVAEGLRVPFTKFILLFVLAYSVCIAVSIDSMWRALQKVHLIQQGAVAIVTFALCILALPAISGGFLSPLMRIRLPDDYTKLYTYFQKQPADTRIAILPQPAYWSWKLYQFGYHGSGFIWFGLPQSVLDRAFDPWGAANEGYYWELSFALYSKNQALLSSVLDKYDISYIVIDEYILSFSNNRSLFTDESKLLLSQLKDFRESESFGKISVYERVGIASNHFVSLENNLPVVTPVYRWTDNDVAFATVGDYIASPSCLTGALCHEYPFRSIFTKRAVSEREITISETPDSIDIGSITQATTASILKASTLTYDSAVSKDLDSLNVKECGLLREGRALATTVTQQGTPALRFDSLNQRGCLSFTIPQLSHKFGYLVAVESRHGTGRPLMISFISNTARHVEAEAYLPDSTDATTTFFVLPPLAADGLGYTIYVSNDAIGKVPTTNDLSRIRMYQLPYADMVRVTTASGLFLEEKHENSDVAVEHPNPSYYKVTVGSPVESSSHTTLILSQSYDTGWFAFIATAQFPFVKSAGSHVLIDNWKNGWILDTQEAQTVHIIFWPQLLEFIGFILLPLPFIYLSKWKT